MSEDKEQQGGADIAVKVAGQEVNVKNVKSLNTILTMLTFTVTCLIAYALYMHRDDTISAQAASKEDRNLFIQAVREQTKAIREGNSELRLQNCLSKFPEKDRAANDAWCKQISGTR